MLEILTDVFLHFDRIDRAGFSQCVAAVVEQQHALLLDVRVEVVASLKVFVQVFDVFGDYRGAGPVKSKPFQSPLDRLSQSGLTFHRGVARSSVTTSKSKSLW